MIEFEPVGKTNKHKRLSKSLIDKISSDFNEKEYPVFLLDFELQIVYKNTPASEKSFSEGFLPNNKARQDIENLYSSIKRSNLPQQKWLALTSQTYIFSAYPYKDSELICFESYTHAHKEKEQDDFLPYFIYDFKNRYGHILYTNSQIQELKSPLDLLSNIEKNQRGIVLKQFRELENQKNSTIEIECQLSGRGTSLYKISCLQIDEILIGVLLHNKTIDIRSERTMSNKALSKGEIWYYRVDEKLCYLDRVGKKNISGHYWKFFLPKIYKEDRYELISHLKLLKQNPDRKGSILYRINDNENNFQWIKSTYKPVFDRTKQCIAYIGFNEIVQEQFITSNEIKNLITESSTTNWKIDFRKNEIHFFDTDHKKDEIPIQAKLQEIWQFVDASGKLKILRRLKYSCVSLNKDFVEEIKINIDEQTSLWFTIISTITKCINQYPIELSGVIINSTQTKQNEISLKENNDRLETIMASLTDGIIILTNPEKIWYVNEAFCKMHEYTSEEFYAMKGPAFVHENTIPKFIQFFDNLSKGIPFEIEGQDISKSGKVINIQVEGKPVFIGGERKFFARVRDTTEEIKRKKELENREKLSRNIVESLPDIVIRLDQEYIFKEFQMAEGEEFPYTKEELINKKICEIFPKNHCALIENLKTDEGATFSEITLNDNIYETRYIPLLGKETLLLMRDISKQRKYELELKNAKIKADAANIAKSEFLSNMSHEIRTPLNAVIGFSEALSDKLDGADKKLASSIVTAGQGLLTLINDILDMSKIEAGGLELQPENYSMQNMLHELSAIFSFKAKKKEIDFIVESTDHLPYTLIVDGNRIKQVLINLIGNAIKFTHSGYVKTWAEYDIKQKELKLHVQDSGIGIPKSQQEVIFDAFRQTDGQSNREYAGTGLGLSISLKIVQLMNGEIKIVSEEGKGSTFTIIIPEVEASESAEDTETDEILEGDVLFEPAKIIIVDDVESNRISLSLFLEKFEFEILQAENGQHALEIMENFEPDLMFVDIRMPKIDGFQLNKIIKEKYAQCDINLVAYTASLLGEDMARLHKIFHHVLNKPATRKEILSVLIDAIPYTLRSKNVEVQPTLELIPTEAIEMQNENLQEINDKLESYWLPKFNEINELKMLFEIEEFAAEFEKFSHDQCQNLFEQYCRELQQATEAFDTEKSEALFEKFTDIIEAVKNKVK